jgi:hypothetical protein
MANDERRKMSWREIDKSRDGSSSRSGSGSSRGGERGSSGPRTGFGGGAEEQRQKQYRAALEQAFAKGELGKLADKLNLLGRGAPAEEVRPAAVPAPASGPASVAAATGAAAGEAEDAGKRTTKRKPADEKQTLQRKVLESASRHETSKAAEKYLARFPLPDDHEFLEHLLDHEQDGRIKQALTRIVELIDNRHPPKRTRALIGKLRYLTETTSDGEIRETAQTLLSRLQ